MLESAGSLYFVPKKRKSCCLSENRLNEDTTLQFYTRRVVVVGCSEVCSACRFFFF